ncbi:MAG: right-handed parallel beta-helix repeat-containing protein [Planctomycetes bacterium]|nr:right-handed parallel beta-helix repeat-containing protein [Planctomycetota bacterium]
MKKMSRRLLSAVIVLMTGSQTLLAQDAAVPNEAAPIRTERFANVFDPSSRTYFSLQGTEGKDFGGTQPFASLGATHYTGSIDSAVTLYSGQFMMNYNAINGIPAGSLGAQQRWMTQLPVLDTTILGAGLYVDFTQSRYNNLFQQINLNFELMTESAWVTRFNAYLPVGQNEQGTGIGSVVGGPPGQLSVVGTTVGTGGINRQWQDVALMGADLELGRKFFNYRVEAYGGYYNWNGPLAGFTNGVKGGVRGYITNNLSGNVNISHDQFFGTNVYGGLTYFFGGPGGNRPMSFQNLMTLPAQRLQQVSVSNFVRDTSTFKAAYDVNSGDQLHMYFVKEAGAGAGTQSNPSNVNSVLADTNFGTGSAMVLLDANGNITSPIALTHDRQQIIGGGSTGTANVDFSLALGQAPGTSVVHLSALGGRPVLAPTVGDAVTLTNQNVVQGFTIDGSGGITNGIVGNPGATDTLIRDMHIQNITGTGILIQPSTNTTIDNVVFANNGQDLLLNAANSTITNITSTNAVNGSINLGGGGGDITGTTLISNVSITNSGGNAILLNNAQNAAVINLTDVTVSGGTGTGLQVSNSQAGSIYNLTNVDILNVGGNGTLLTASNGTFNADATSSITNTGAPAFAINGGAIDVNYGGTIGQANAASALLVTGNHTGTASFTNSITTTNGDGLQFNGANGTYNLTGTINMNGGDAGIDIFNSNGTFAFNNPYINNTASGMGVKIVGDISNKPVTTFTGLDITTTSNTGFFVDNSGLTTVNGTANVNTGTGTALDLQGTPLAAVFTNVTSDLSPTSGININNSSGTFGITGVATVTNASGSGINIMNSSTLTSTIQSVALSTIGSGAADNGVTLTTAGNVSILGGTIDGVTGDGIHSTNTSLTATGLTIGGSSAVVGDGIEIINSNVQQDVVLSNNTITAGVHAIRTTDGGISKELLLTLDGNTLQSTGGSAALQIVGSGLDSTIIQSMNGGTIVGGLSGGANFNRVTFDASGRALSGTQVVAGDWTIGTTGARVQGDGLHFDNPTGDLAFGNLNIANDTGTGLYVNTKGLGTTFSLGNSGGTVDTTGGAALFLDPLTTNLTFSTVSSTNSATDGITLDTVAGTVNLGTVTVNNATNNGVNVSNSTAAVTIGAVNVDGAVTGINLLNNTGGSFTVTGVGAAGAGGTIQNVTDRGVLSVDSVNTSLNNMVIDASTGTRGIGVLTTTGTNTFSLTNSTVTGGTEQAVAIGADVTGVLNATLDGNTMSGTATNPQGAGFVGITSAADLSGGTLNLAFSNNSVSSVQSAGAYISNFNPTSLTTGGTVTVTNFANNTVTTSNVGQAAGPLTGGILFSGVTFDSDLSTAGIQSVNGGTLTIGSVSTPTNVVGDGLRLNDVSGDLAFTTVNIGNDSGTGLYVNTKVNSTTFNLSSTGGTINTSNGAALYLDPLTTNMTLTSVTSTNSATNGITLDTVGGTLDIGTVSVTNATGSGVSMNNSSAAVNVGSLTVNGAADGLTFGTNTGSFNATGTTTISNVTSAGINMNGATGTYTFGNLNVDTTGAARGLDFRNSSVSFTSGNTAITGDGSINGIAIDLSGSLNPNGVNSSTPNILLGTGATETAMINNIHTGVLMGDAGNGSAGAYLVYGNQTPLNSGSQINVIAGGLTLDATNLTSTTPYAQGRYEFLGVSFTGNTSFPNQVGPSYIFVGATSGGADDGSTPTDRIDITQLLALDATPSNLDGKTIVLVNDTGSPINMGSNSLVLGDNTVLDTFTGSNSFMGTGLIVPVNVIVDTIGSAPTYTDPFGNGTATLTNDGSQNLVSLGNNDTIQDVSLSGGLNGIVGNGVTGANINNLNISGSSIDGILLTLTTGSTSIDNVTISNVGGDGVILNSAGTVSFTNGSISNTGTDGITSIDTDLTVNGNTINSGITATAIDIVNLGNARTVQISNNNLSGGASAVSSSDSGTAGELTLTLDGNTYASEGVGSKAINVVGSGLNSTIVASMNGGTVNNNNTNGGGVNFNQVTFDASGTALSGTTVNAGDWTIGANNPVNGDGLRMTDPSGNLAFGNLNITNDSGTGLYVDVKSLGTTFSLNNTGGTITTTNGAAVFLDPPPPSSVNVNMTFDAVNSSNSATSGITLDTVGGSFTVNGGLITGAAGPAVSINNSSADVLLNGTTLTGTNTGAVVKLNGDSGTVTLTDLTLNRPADGTAFDIDATSGSTGKITIDGTSTIGSNPGTAFLIGAGSRDIDATALSITNDNTTTGPVISITGQTGGTIGFGSITNSSTNANNVIFTTGQTGGTVNFGTTLITGFGNAGTDTAVSLGGSAGTVNFSDLDITTTNGAGLNVGGITFSAGSSPTINATGGTALTMNGTTLSGGAQTFDSITQSGGVNGINLANVTGTTTFTTVSIANTSDDGVHLNNAGTVLLNGGSIDAAGDDGIDSTDTNLTASGLTIGGTTAAADFGVRIVNTTGQQTIVLSNNAITANFDGINSSDSGTSKSLILTLDGNTVQSTGGGRAINLVGSGLNSTIVQSMSGGTIIGGASSGGVEFNRVTFDASGAALSGTQVSAGNWTIGTTLARVNGDGLRFDAPTGDVAFGTLNIANDSGTGLYVDTKTLGTTFNLGSSGGSIDTTNGSAAYLDPLTTNMTLGSLTSTGSSANGVWLDGVAGTFTVTGATTVTNAVINGIQIDNSSGTLTFNGVSVDTTGGDGVNINSNTGTINFNGTSTIQNTLGDGIDETSAGGGVNFGTTDITNAGMDGINLNSASGSYTFGATTIHGFRINRTGVNFTGSSAAATFGVTDIQNGGYGTGIDLSSTTGNHVITFATGSSISNVNLGVELSSGHTNATSADANFTFGDGSGVDGNGTNSQINATTTVNVIGLSAALGTYNFNDVAFTGTASLPAGAGGATFVSATAVNGAGDGSYLNPYSVSDADAITTANTTFVFLDGTYDFNTLNGGHSFSLSATQNVEGFDNGNTVAYGTVQPANVFGNLGASGGVASRTSSLSITDSAADGIFDLAGGNSLLDITLSGSAATTYLVNSNSGTVGFDNTAGISLNGVTMSNPAGTFAAMQFTNLTGNVSVQGNNINMSSGSLVNIFGGSATYTIAAGTQPDPGSTAGVLAGTNTGMSIVGTTGGSVSIDGMSLSSAGTVLSLSTNAATLSFTNNTFSSTGTLFSIDQFGSSTSDLTFDNTNTITQSTGVLADIGAGARNIDLSAFNFNNSGTTVTSVINSVGQTGGTIKFGNIGITGYNNAAGTAVSLQGSGGTVQFGDLDITATNGNGLNVGGITFDAGATPTISTSNGAALVMNGTTLSGGSQLFASVDSTGGTNGVSLTNVTGTTTITSVGISGSTGDGIALSNAGTVILNGGTIDGTGGDGIHSANTDLTVYGMLIGNGTSTTGDGLQVVNTASHLLSIGNTTVTDAGGAGITIDGSGGGTTTVTSFNGNTVSNAGAGGILFNTVTFDADTATGGIQQVAGGNTTIGSLVTTTNVTGDGLVLNNVLGDIAFGTLNIGNDNGTGLYIRDAGGKGGSFAFGNTGGTINTTNGPAMDIDPVTMNSTFASVSSTNANGQGISTFGNGINLNTVTGSVTINGGSITGATGGSFVVDGGNATVLYKGGITNTAGRLVSVSNTTGGSVTFNTGTLTDSGTGANTGTGILLSSNAGNVSFNGTTTITNSDSTGVDIQGGSGTFTFGTGTTIASATGIDFNVNGGTSSVTYSGGMTQAVNNVALVNVQGGHGTGTLTFQTGTLDATAGTGLQFNNADGIYNFNGTTTLHGGDAGVDIVNGSGGTFTFGTGTAITDPSGLPYHEDTSTANVTFNGSITKTSSSNSAIFINGKTGGTTSFNGLITASTGATNAISLTSNTGGTINFGNTSGTSNITTTSGNGFNFTGGGALNITGNNYVVNTTSGTGFNATAGTVTATGSGNTIASTTGRAVNINGATIGAGGVTFKSVSANGGTTSAILLSGTGAGNFTVTGDGTAAAGALGGNASGGTIQNITGADAISLNNVGGTVSLNSMSILNIAASTDATDAKQTVSGVDAIQGTGTIGGLSLVGVTINGTSDMAVNGPTGSAWTGLTINNSLLEFSNRYGVAGKGDDNNEGMVQIYGLTGTASITNSKFDSGSRFLDLQTSTTGNLNVTATNNLFSNSWKGFNSAPDAIYQVGGDAIRLRSNGSATMTAIIGDVNETNPALGNTFLNDLYSIRVGNSNPTDTGLVKTLISENTFQVTTHLSPTGAPLYSIPYGSVLLSPLGTGNMDGTVSNNTFDQTFDTAGLAGSVSIAADGGNNNQFKITGNNFINPWDRAIEIRSNNGAVATALVSGNTYASSTAGGAGTDAPAFTGPYDANRFWTLNNSTLNLTWTNETDTSVATSNAAQINTSNAGDTLNVFLSNLHNPWGYNIGGVGTNNVFRNGSASGTIQTILQDNNVTGGSGTAGTSPPAVSTSGTINFSAGTATLPSYTIP